MARTVRCVNTSMLTLLRRTGRGPRKGLVDRDAKTRRLLVRAKARVRQVAVGAEVAAAAAAADRARGSDAVARLWFHWRLPR